jgi:hypothetical protein
LIEIVKYDSTQKLVKKINTPSIINSTKPVLYDTGDVNFPYAYAGTCYPVKWENNFYIISSAHCYENHSVKPEKTLYPIPHSSPLQFYGFNVKLTVDSNQFQGEKYKDQVILKVSNKLHTKDTIDLTKALDISKNSSIVSFSEINIEDIWIGGYLLSNDNSLDIDYDNKKMKSTLHISNRIISSRISSFAFCYYLKVPEDFLGETSYKGLSGSPVYIKSKENIVGLAGTIIEFNEYTNEFLVIDSIVLREYLERENLLNSVNS